MVKGCLGSHTKSGGCGVGVWSRSLSLAIRTYPVVSQQYHRLVAMSRTDKSLYVKHFSSLKYGAPIYRPCDVQLGDVGFIDTQDGFFQKLYNVSNPPQNVPGCPPPLELVKCTPLI